MPDVFFPSGVLTVAGSYKPGDLPPEGYLEWHEWAEVQRKAGIKQVPCGKCGRWKTPQELSGEVLEYEAMDRRGRPVKVTGPVCIKCKSSNAKVRGPEAALSPEAPSRLPGSAAGDHEAP